MPITRHICISFAKKNYGCSRYRDYVRGVRVLFNSVVG